MHRKMLFLNPFSYLLANTFFSTLFLMSSYPQRYCINVLFRAETQICPFFLTLCAVLGLFIHFHLLQTKFSLRLGYLNIMYVHDWSLHPNWYETLSFSFYMLHYYNTWKLFVYSRSKNYIWSYKIIWFNNKEMLVTEARSKVVRISHPAPPASEYQGIRFDSTF